jgi:hypothetical protein
MRCSGQLSKWLAAKKQAWISILTSEERREG